MRFVKSAIVIMVLALAVSAVLAQSRNTGALRGVVTDETGGRIPGVLVILESPDMIGGQKAVTTDAQGSYRFPELPPGNYTLTFSISGYQTIKRDSIPVQATKTFDVDQALTPRAGEVTVTVSSEAPLVDVTSSASSTILNEDYLQNLPTGRFQPDTLNLAPGIKNSSAYGGGESSGNAYQLDGVDVSDPEAGSPWSFVNYNIIKEAQLVALGAPAEYGGFTGVLFNSVTKSGSNDVSGMLDGYLFPPSWVGTNTDDPGLQPPEIDKSYDTTAQIGGPIMKDKLWYFASAQYAYDARSSGGPLRSEETPRAFGKLDWQLNKDNRFTFWVEWDRFDVTGRDGDAFTPLEATVTESAPEYVWNISWNRIISPNTSFNFSYTGFWGYYYLDPSSGYSTSGRLDSDGFTSDNSLYWYKADRTRHQAVASISHFSDAWAGKHDIKYGVELERSWLRSQAGTPGKAYYYDYLGSPSYAPYTIAYIGYSYDLEATNMRATAFVQDSWQINDRWTVNPGLRFDFNRGSVPGNANIYRTNPLALRLGFAYDVTGKKRTVLRGHYGRYYEGLKGNYYSQAGPGRLTLPDQWQFPLGGPFDKNNPGATATLLVPSRQQDVEMDRDVKQPYLDQYVLGIDHDLGNDFAVSLDLVYRKNKDFVESVSLDGDFVKVIGVEDNGQRVSLFNQQNLNDTLIITNPHELKRDYYGAIFKATKRFTKRWLGLFSYARQNTTGNIDNTFARNAGPGTFLDTPNSLVNGQGALTNDYKHEVQVQAQYIIPKIETSVSLNYSYYSGQTYTATDSTTTFLDPNGGAPISFNQGRVSFLAESRGSQRLNATNLLDLRVEKYFTFGGGTRLGIYGDAFNLFNQGVATAVVTNQASSFFEDPSSFSTPRTVRIGVRYNF